jgi:molybdate transport system substrate-binding protein
MVSGSGIRDCGKRDYAETEEVTSAAGDEQMKIAPPATIALFLAMAQGVQAAEIAVFATGATRDAFKELAPQFERETGHKISAQFDLPPNLYRKIDAGEPFDVILLSTDVEPLIKQGKVAADSRTVLGRTGIGVAIPQGRRKPDFATVEAFKRELLDAKAIATSGEGSSGRYVLALLERLGIADEVKPKLRTGGPGSAAQFVARGEVDFAVIGLPPVLGIPGVEWLGWLPPEIQSWLLFTGGVATAAKEPAAGRALLTFLTTPVAAAVFKAKGLEPVP